jgi:hypothetical protein
MLGQTRGVRPRKPDARLPSGLVERDAPFATRGCLLPDRPVEPARWPTPAVFLAADPQQKNHRNLIGLAFLVNAGGGRRAVAPSKVSELMGEESAQLPRGELVQRPSVMSRATVCGQRGSCRIATETLTWGSGTIPSRTTASRNGAGGRGLAQPTKIMIATTRPAPTRPTRTGATPSLLSSEARPDQYLWKCWAISKATSLSSKPRTSERFTVR